MLVAVTDIKGSAGYVSAGEQVPDDWDEDEVKQLKAAGAVEEPQSPPDTIVIPVSALADLPPEAKEALAKAGFDLEPKPNTTTTAPSSATTTPPGEASGTDEKTGADEHSAKDSIPVGQEGNKGDAGAANADGTLTEDDKKSKAAAPKAAEGDKA